MTAFIQDFYQFQVRSNQVYGKVEHTDACISGIRITTDADSPHMPTQSVLVT